uniref:EF-hand domain-containing protein n=1 Tax=Florenciella parvula TaxID=236787 RepID=A0A7S2CDI7_9STRA|eukprot:CAMPEP_0182534452 /NCGR_PEP_ID=MMETSP1323-20130603/15792_1 /TAXON_ID=236787 /ORGANISM="Florenciella parvula, Strain RCC1693" /LENGTH=415 /DNA_ID=CAMNT_0024744469 /DNA_START=45 /DNA_END=1292 /DNA_ORIENTATION=+
MASARRDRVPLTGRSNAAAASRTAPIPLSSRSASRMAGTPSGVSQWSGRPVDASARSGAAGPNAAPNPRAAETVADASASARRERIMKNFMSGAGAKKKSDTSRSTDSYSEWNNTHHVTSAARDNHVFGFGLGGAGRHEQIVNGITPMEVFEKKDAPLPTSTVGHHTHWRDDPEAIPRRRQRKGRPQGSEGIEAFDIDGDGTIDESEVLISSFMKNEHEAHNPTWEDPMWGGDGATDHVPLKLTARSKERKQQQKIDAGRREMVRRYWHDNRDHLWCIDPNLRGKGITDSIDTLMNTCEDKYNGNFALMMRNLHHDAVQLRQQSSVQTQMVVRPPVTCRINASLEVAGYKDGYKTARMKQEERINRVYAQIAQEGRSTSNPGGYDHNRKKGTEYGYGNMAGWCAARAKHPFAAHM